MFIFFTRSTWRHALAFWGLCLVSLVLTRCGRLWSRGAPPVDSRPMPSRHWLDNIRNRLGFKEDGKYDTREISSRGELESGGRAMHLGGFI